MRRDLTWKQRRLGVGYFMGVRRRQVSVGKPAEHVAVLRLYEGADANDEVVLTRRDLCFLIDTFDHHGEDVLPLRYRIARRMQERRHA